MAGEHKVVFILTGWMVCYALRSASAGNELGRPFFEKPQTVSVNATEGQTVYLDCKVFQIGTKMVTWARHHNGTIELITYGLTPFHDDRRFSIRFEHPGNWRLRISALRTEDSGQYVCQISTDPPTKKSVILKVQNPQITVRDSKSLPIHEYYAMTGRDLSLECFAEPVSVYTKSVSFWSYNNSRLKPREGKIWTEGLKSENSSSLWLHLRDIQPSDAGVYSCATKGSRGHSVTVHVINDSSSGTALLCPQYTSICSAFSFLILLRTDR